MKVNNAAAVRLLILHAMIAAGTLVGFAAADASAQCTLVVRDSFFPGPRPHGGNGKPRLAQIHDTMVGYWPQLPSDGTQWISSDQSGVPQWQFAGTSLDPSEVDPLDEYNGTAFADATAVALLPFAAPSQPFTTSANVVMGSGTNSTVCIGYTSGAALWNNLASFGSLWMTLDGNGNWSIRANGNAIVASGAAPIVGVINSGWLHMEFTYDAAAHTVSGRVMETAITATPVTLTRPLTYFAMENQVGWGVVNNLSIYTGDGLTASASGPSTLTPGVPAQYGVASNVSGNAVYQWQWQPSPSAGWYNVVTGPNGVDPANTAQFVAQGANASSLTITPTSGVASGLQLRCVVSGVCGSAASLPVTLTSCVADFNADGFLDFTDFDGFVAAFEAGAAAADFNADGFLDFTDFDAFVAAFEAGC